MAPSSDLAEAADQQIVARAVASPGGFLVTWTDWRSTPGAPYGARIDGSGRILDPLGIELPATLAAWSGRDFVIVDVDYVTGHMTVHRLPERGGTPRETARVAGHSGLLASEVASNGDDLLVLATDTTTHDDYLIRLHAILVDERGEVKRIAVSDSFSPRARVFAMGSRYVVLLDEKQCRQERCPRNTYLLTIERDGKFSKRMVMANGSDDRHLVAAAVNGRELLAVLAHMPDFADGTIEAAVVDIRTGNATPRRVLGAFPQQSHRGSFAAAAWDGSSFVAWWQDKGIRTRRIAIDGAPQGEAETITPDSVQALTAAGAGAAAIVAWSDGELLSKNGELHSKVGTAPPMLVARAKPRPHPPRIAAAGSELLMARHVPHSAIAANERESVEVWMEPAHDAVLRLMGQRFDRHGQPIGERVAVDRCEALSHWPPAHGDVSIATDGSGYLTVWPCAGQRELRLVRLDRELRSLSAVKIEPHQDQYAAMLPPPEPPRMWSPRVVWNGSSFLVAWFETTSKGPLRVARWEGDGIIDVQSIPASPLRDATLSLSSRNGRTMAAWIDYRAAGDELCVVAWTIGEPKGTTVYCEPPILARGDFVNVVDPAIAADRLVAWAALRNGQYDLFAARLDDLHPFPIAASPQDERHPELLAVGDSLVHAAYQRVTPEAGNVTRTYRRTIQLDPSDELAISRNRSGPAARAQSDPHLGASPSDRFVVWCDDRMQFGETYGARVDSNLRVLDLQGIPLFPRGYHNPRVAWTGWEFLVAAEQGDHVDARRVSVAGVVSEPIRLAAVPGLSGLASNGKSTLVLAGRPLTATLLGEDGAPRPAIPLGKDQQLAGHVRTLAEGYAFVLHDAKQAQLVRLSQDGRITRRRIPLPAEVVMATASITPAGDIVLVTARRHSRRYVLEARVLDAPVQEVAVLDSFPMTVAAGWDGFAHAVAWGENGAMYARRVDGSGKPLSDRKKLGGADPGSGADVDANFIVWSQHGNIMAADVTREQEPTVVSLSGREQQSVRLASDGRRVFTALREPGETPVILTGFPPLAEGGFAIPAGSVLASNPGVAWLGDHYLVLWTQWTSGAPKQRLMAQRFDAEGKPLGEPLVVAEQFSGAEEAPSLATNGETLVVVWPGNPGATILKLDRELRVIGKRDVMATYQTAALMTPPPPLQPLLQTQVVWTGSAYVAGWASPGGLRFVRLGDDLSFEDLAGIPLHGYRGMALSARDGQAVAAWITNENCLVTGLVASDVRTTIACGVAAQPAFARNAVALAWVSEEGIVTVKDGSKPPIVVATGASQHPPSVAITPNGITVAYTRTVGVPRGYVRTLPRD